MTDDKPAEKSGGLVASGKDFVKSTSTERIIALAVVGLFAYFMVEVEPAQEKANSLKMSEISKQLTALTETTTDISEELKAVSTRQDQLVNRYDILTRVIEVIREEGKKACGEREADGYAAGQGADEVQD